ncbi:MAG: hypothetical protein WB870_11645, partial [Gallionellaceae bacterium]
SLEGRNRVMYRCLSGNAIIYGDLSRGTTAWDVDRTGLTDGSIGWVTRIDADAPCISFDA